ncbi:uncharacterized protein LOC120344036 [Styela clava]
MRLTAVIRSSIEKAVPTNRRRTPRASFRRPMQGRYTDRKKEPKPWETSMGELDEEEVNELGQTIPVREKIPMIMVPDLKDFNLKPYVSYKAEKHHEPPLQAKELFDMFYAPQIEAEMSGTKLETIPEPEEKGLLGKIKYMFKMRKEAKSNDKTEQS